MVHMIAAAGNKDHQKVILAGDDAVGSSYAFTLATQNIVQEIGIININVPKTEGDTLDLSHALASTSPKKIYAVACDDYHDADLIVLTADTSQKPGETHLDLVHKNLRISKEIVTTVADSGFNGVFLIAVNPVNILTYSTWKLSGFPKGRVIGSGTSLDSVRFRQATVELVNVDVRNVHAHILGEHGDIEFPVWSHANAAGLQIYKWMKNNPDVDEEAMVNLLFNVCDAAYTIIGKKGVTFYRIAVALARITKAILNDENSVLPLPAYLEGEYGQSDIYIGAPAIIDRQGVKQVIGIPLADAEQERMEASASALKEVIETAFAKFEAGEVKQLLLQQSKIKNNQE